MKNVWKFVSIILIVAALVGCQQAEAAPETSTSTEPSTAGAPAGGRGGLDDVSQLALGTMELEGTADAVTAAQASELLPLWQIIQSGTLEGAAETSAVAKQIEGKMTASQLAAIEAMGLTTEDMQTWMSEQGIEMPAGAVQGQEGPGALGDLSEDERAKMREQFQNMDPEERATQMAERGIERPEGGEGAGGGPGGGRTGGTMGGNVLVGPLMQLLTERAAQA